MNPSPLTVPVHGRAVMRVIGAVFVLTSVAVAAAQEPLAITAPAPGSTVAPGETLTVMLASPSGQSFSLVYIVGQDFIGMGRSATSVPAQFPIDVPADARLGPYFLTANGTTATNADVTVKTQIVVERTDLPTTLTVRVPQVMFERQGQRSTIDLLATFADAAVLDATASTRVTYASSDANVVTVDSRGNLQAVNSGVAEVTATYTLATESRQALVRVVVPSPPYTLTPNALDFGEQAVGTSSSRDMTLANTSPDPISIGSVVAVGEYSATNNCVSSVPLPVSGTCTITVTFAPATTGSRPGTLQITELEETFGFQLTGIGTGGGGGPTVTITSFTPSAGPIGTSISITGTGFSATPAQNTVTFSGTAAAVTSSTTTSIDVTVPSGAMTGLIAVTSPSGSATSGTTFTVTVPDPPTITGFAPTIGVAGTPVTVTGTSFALVAASNQTKFNETETTPNDATSTTVTAAVPANTGSGRIRITTTAGTAVSGADFIIPPSPYVAADVAISGRLPFGTQTPVSVSTGNKIGLFLFDGTAGQRVSLAGTNGVSGQVAFLCDLNVSIRRPDGAQLVGPTCMEGSGFIDATALPTSGTYTVVIDPEGSVTGGVTLMLYDVPADFNAGITAGGSAVTATMTTPGQNGALTFVGAANGRVSLVGTNGLSGQVAFVCDVNARILKPDGSVLVGNSCMESSGFVDAITLPVSGTYTITLNPESWATGNVTLNLYNVADSSGSVTPGGSAVTVSLPTPGQNATLTFAGTAGQKISVVGSNGLSGQIAFVCDVNLSIRKPDGSVLAGPTCMEGSGFIDAQTLPVTGTYSLFVNPEGAATGNLTLNVYSVADYTGTITIGGSAVTVTMPTPGQNGLLTFAGTAGQRVSLLGTNGVSGQIAFSCDVTVSILKPDGTTFVAPTCMEGSGFIDTQTLPVTGTYSVVINPQAHAVGNLTLTLYEVTDAAGTVTIGGAPVTVTLSTPGQNGTLTFTGNTGQQISLAGSNGTISAQMFVCDVSVSIKKPDGSVLAGPTCMEGSGSINGITLPTTGTYTVFIDPLSGATGSLTLTLTSGSD